MALLRKTPLKRGPFLRRTKLAKVGKQKPKRVKRQKSHYASKYWKILRCLIWQRDGGICQDCGIVLESIADMDAAHITNKDFGAEKLYQVKCSCKPCNAAERALRSWYAGPVLRK